MANPFLVLGGVAVGVITAGIGVLAVPGWISSAQDSAAMNDLGSIRGAESASVLMLGEYTDDSTVLRSGELGVKFQKSDGVTLIGLKADTNESWCASVQSASGKYFAASSIGARIATGPGAESAMTTAGCEPTLIDSIIADAAAGTGPGGAGVDVGVPGASGGSWVGGSGGSDAGAPGGGSGGGGASLGPAIEFMYLANVTVTANGSYSVDANGKLIQGGGDGRAHEVTVTGAAAGKTLNYQSDIAMDASGNVYVSDNDWSNPSIYRIAPDRSSTLITALPADTGSGRFVSSPNGTIYWHYGPEIWILNGDKLDLWTTLAKDTDGQPVYTTSVDINDSGQIVALLPAEVWRATASTRATRVAQSPEMQQNDGVALANDGSMVIGSNYNDTWTGPLNLLWRVSPANAVQRVQLDPGIWGVAKISNAADDSGNVFFTGGTGAFKFSPDNTVTPFITN